jgi:hypothetical protein
MADSADAPADLLSLLAEALVLLVRSLGFLFDLLQTYGLLWGAPWAALCRLITGVLELFLHLTEPLLRLSRDLLSCQLLAQTTHPYMPSEKGRKALLEHLRQGM